MSDINETDSVIIVICGLMLTWAVYQVLFWLGWV